jgi:glycosyltransferase involved in cell wall biosynthesis
MNTVLYIHEEPPQEGLGCPVIVRRHLLRLEEKGWKITVVAASQFMEGASIPPSWRCIIMPRRRWWWPPCRTTLGWAHRIRLFWETREIRRELKGSQPDLLLTQLHRRYPLLAAHLSHVWNVRLGLFIFDEREVWERDEKARRRLLAESKVVLRAADHIWTVSDELRDAYQAMTGAEISDRFTRLIPIPEGLPSASAQWNSDFANRPVVACAGSLHGFHLPLLRLVAKALDRMNGELLLVCDHGNEAYRTLIEECGNVRRHDAFQHNTDCVEFLMQNASALLVSYAFDLKLQPWARRSFPSKFVEFSHTGLPILLAAPEGSAIQSWARSNSWHGLIEKPDAEAALAYVRGLTQPARWRALADQSRRVAQGEFDPAKIQEQFERELISR